jgi:hypothetical protein
VFSAPRVLRHRTHQLRPGYRAHCVGPAAAPHACPAAPLAPAPANRLKTHAVGGGLADDPGALAGGEQARRQPARAAQQVRVPLIRGPQAVNLSTPGASAWARRCLLGWGVLRYFAGRGGNGSWTVADSSAIRRVAAVACTADHAAATVCFDPTAEPLTHVRWTIRIWPGCAPTLRSRTTTSGPSWTDTGCNPDREHLLR